MNSEMSPSPGRMAQNSLLPVTKIIKVSSTGEHTGKFLDVYTFGIEDDKQRRIVTSMDGEDNLFIFQMCLTL